MCNRTMNNNNKLLWRYSFHFIHFKPLDWCLTFTSNIYCWNTYVHLLFVLAREYRALINYININTIKLLLFCPSYNADWVFFLFQIHIFLPRIVEFRRWTWAKSARLQESVLKNRNGSMAERFKIDQTKWSRSSLATHNSQMTQMLALTRCCVNSNSSFSHANIYIVFEKVGALSDIVDNLYSQYFQMLWYFHIYWRKKKHIEISLINSILSINSSNFQCKLHTTSSIN